MPSVILLQLKLLLWFVIIHCSEYSCLMTGCGKRIGFFYVLVDFLKQKFPSNGGREGTRTETPGFERRDAAWPERASPQRGSGDGGFALSFKNNLLCKAGQYPAPQLCLLTLHIWCSCLCPAPCRMGPAFDKKK